MSRIIITEDEKLSAAVLNITDNVALIPLCMKPVSGKPASEEAQLFESESGFTEKFKEDDVTKIDDTSAQYKYDPSYIMIKNLLNLGLKVVVKPLASAESYGGLTEMRQFVNKSIGEDKKFDEFESKNIYNIKFITSGAHPNHGVENACSAKLAACAANRADAVALIEVDFNKTPADVIAMFTSEPDNAKYCVSTYPACDFTFGSGVITLPGAYAYLATFATSVSRYPNWYAAAGIDRGIVPGLDKVKHEVTEAQANVFSGITTGMYVHVNPIMKLGSRGYRLFGNNVMAKIVGTATKTSYLNFLNVRMLLCDIKKQIYDAANRTIFEPNDDITYINFQAMVNQLLDKMKTGRGLQWYAWTKDPVADIGVIKANLTIKPIEAVEKIEMNITLTDSDVSGLTSVQTEEI